MAKNRWVDTRFWSDNFIREHLNPLDRYLFLYFLTNEKTNIAGIYELPLSTMASETGLEKEMLTKMLGRLKGRIEYHDGWVVIRNFQKYQKTGSKDLELGIKRIMDKEVPPNIRVFAENLVHGGDPLPTVPLPIPILVPNPIPNGAKVSAKDFNDVYKVLEAFKPVNPHYSNLMDSKSQYDAAMRMLTIHGLESVLKVIEILPASNKKPYVTTITTPMQLEMKWATLAAQLTKEQRKTAGKARPSI